jgi:beta-lactamase superfamily II metal-dependent hydrolase
MKNWKAILALVAVFILGMIAGGSLMTASTAKRLHRLMRGQTAFTAQEVTRRLTRQLRLDAGQRDQMLVLVEAAQVQITNARKQCVPQVLAALDDFDAKARPILRPDQVERFDKLVAERKARWAN